MDYNQPHVTGRSVPVLLDKTDLEKMHLNLFRNRKMKNHLASAITLSIAD